MEQLYVVRLSFCYARIGVAISTNHCGALSGGLIYPPLRWIDWGSWWDERLFGLLPRLSAVVTVTPALRGLMESRN